MAPQVVDTNVPVTANLALDPSTPVELLPCVRNCVEAIESVIDKGGLVLDSGDEIFNEYRSNLSLKGQPGVGDKFLKWVHDHRFSLPDEDRVSITPQGMSYVEFPIFSGLENFDTSDRKFVAVANAHPKKPQILQATDSKWWGWKAPLAQIGITVVFLCEGWIEKKYGEKMGQ